MTAPSPIYLDHHATTPVDPRVLEAMLPHFRESFGNPSSNSHAFGWEAAEAVEEARGRVAAFVGASREEILFTAGATESDNVVIQGLARAASSGKGPLAGRRHFVVSAVEHKCILETCGALAADGFRTTVVPPEPDGVVDPSRLLAAVADDTLLVCLMAVQNEVGTLQPVAEVGTALRRRGVLFLVDAPQAAGRVAMDVRGHSIDYLALSAHKFYGPKGIGALYARKGTPTLPAVFQGGGQERGLRPGTTNVPGAVGLGKAAEIAGQDLAADTERLLALRERLRERLEAEIDGIRWNGSLTRRVAGNLNASFEGVDGEALLLALTDVAVSSGAACTSGAVEASYVLKAMGVPTDLAIASLRFGLGRFNTQDEIDRAAAHVIEKVGKLRAKRAGATGKRRPAGAGARSQT